MPATRPTTINGQTRVVAGVVVVESVMRTQFGYSCPALPGFGDACDRSSTSSRRAEHNLLVTPQVVAALSRYRLMVPMRPCAASLHRVSSGSANSATRTIAAADTTATIVTDRGVR